MFIPDALPVLSKGHHPSGSGRACVMDAVSWLSGRPEEGDAPSCVHPVLRSAAIRVNDLLPDGERHRLWELVPRLIGTAPDDLDSHESRVLSVRLAVWCARRVLPLVRERDRAVCVAAIEAAEGWCEGRVSADECRQAAAADAASYAAAAAADAADAATNAAANAAAANAAANAAATNAAATYAATNAADAADVADAARLALLDGLIAEHERLTGHPEQAISDQQWNELCSLLGVV